MYRNEDRDNEVDGFLREGVREFVPAVHALNAFIHEAETRLRGCLKVHEKELAQLGIASSRGKLDIAPSLGKQYANRVLRIGITGATRWKFFIQLDPDETPTRSMYVGFWLWTPVAKDRLELYKLLRPIWNAEDFETEVPDRDSKTIYVGRYVNQEDNFPAFQTTLDGLIRHVIAGLKEINFAERFGAGFQKQPPLVPSLEPE